ncbi:sigma-70 family RNA polymerase sigma factor [Bacillus cereus]|uniref:sigma-70 family RNA polymerase sigma factor n=1 Tax=Bacillus cereus TaxID=1396 RepID=UPI00397F55C1
MRNNQINAFFEKYRDKLKEPIIQQFLKEPKNYDLFEKAITNPTEENKQKLDNAFKTYYKNIRMISYISKLVYFYSIDFDKKISLNTKRFLLSLDAPIRKEESDTTSKIDILVSSDEDLTYLAFEKLQQSIKDHISDEYLLKALQLLSEKQLRILSLIYINNCTNKQAAKILGESEQNISQHHKRAIKKLKQSIKLT